MSISVTCPECARIIKAPDHMDGRRIKCPDCAASVAVGAKGGKKRRKSGNDDDGDNVRVLRVEAVENDSPSNLAKTLGVVAVVFGVLGVVCIGLQIFMLRQFGFVGMGLAGLGLLIGLIAIVSAISGGRGMALAASGAVVSFLSLGGLVATPLIQRALEPKQEIVRLPEAQVEPVDLTKDIKNAEPKGPPAPTLKDYVDASKAAAKLGNVQVRLMGAVIDKVPIKEDELLKGLGAGGDTRTDEDHIGFRIQVLNLSKNRILNFKGWSGASSSQGLGLDIKEIKKKVMEELSSDGPAPALADEAKNSYDQFMLPSGFGAGKIEGQVSKKLQIHPGEAAEDLLIFNKPYKDFKYLLLDLPAAAFGEQGTVRLMVPRGMVNAARK